MLSFTTSLLVVKSLALFSRQQLITAFTDMKPMNLSQNYSSPIPKSNLEVQTITNPE